ncbi:hypothetical protein EPN52_01610 [bacterium]|nr:MAG: hypothetical protein EPN52_01610 [bacterium]
MHFVVPDDPTISRDIERAILDRGGSVIAAMGLIGLEAVELCRKLHPDGNALAISMPAMG